MTLPQGLAFLIIATAVLLFAWGRFRYDVVALCALLSGVVCGVVPARAAFSGFTSDVVVIIASALVISAAVARTGMIEQALRPLLARLQTAATQVPVLSAATALLSMATKNIGALALLLPVATRLAAATGVSRTSLLMPMSFMSLLGGLVTLVGTSTNIIVSQVRQDTLGQPFQMFDFAPVGLCLTGVGLVVVSIFWRLLPRERRAAGDMAGAVGGSYTTEGRVSGDGGRRHQTLGDLGLAAAGVEARALVRRSVRTMAPDAQTPLEEGDAIVLEGPQEALNAVFTQTPLVHVRSGKEAPKEVASEEMRSIEAVVQRGSALSGRSAARVGLEREFGVNLLAISRGGGAPITERLSDVRLRPGDVLIVQAGERALPGALRSLGLLPLVERDVQLAGVSRRVLPLLILAAAMALIALRIAPVAIAFFGAATLMAATGGVSMREAYAALDAQVLVLIGALTPLSEAVRATGGADLAAGAMATALHGVPPTGVLAALLITAMACSPFMHNAPTVLVLGPIAVSLAGKLHLGVDAFLMAVATGAGCDFLTPVGHQCNTLVMGPGGYRFSDYARLGAPLSLAVIICGTLLIPLFWPLTPR